MAVNQYRSIIRAAGAKYGIPASVLAGLIDVESGGNINAVSPVGAFGLTQFMPGTARTHGVRRGDPRTQIYGAARYLVELGYHKDPKRALAAYNGGPGNPQYGYANTVLSRSKRFSGLKDSGSSTTADLSPNAVSGADSGQRRAILLEWLRSHDPDRTLKAGAALSSLDSDSPTPSTPTTPSAPTSNAKGGRLVQEIGRIAQSQFGLHVGENPAFGGVHGGHAPHSYHYRGRAIDVSGNPAQEAAFANYVARNYGPKLRELFWQGRQGVNIKNGQHVAQGFVSGHRDHVHVAAKRARRLGGQNLLPRRP